MRQNSDRRQGQAAYLEECTTRTILEDGFVDIGGELSSIKILFPCSS
jgi:hypothetical protein